MGFPVTIDGAAIFGFANRFESRPNPRELQVESYAGLDGLEIKDLGDRGRTSMLAGWLVADSLADLRAAFAAIEAFRDGQGHTLTDTYGFAYQNVVLTEIVPEGPPQFATDGTVIRRFRAEFLHATAA